MPCDGKTEFKQDISPFFIFFYEFGSTACNVMEKRSLDRTSPLFSFFSMNLDRRHAQKRKLAHLRFSSPPSTVSTPGRSCRLRHGWSGHITPSSFDRSRARIPCSTPAASSRGRGVGRRSSITPATRGDGRCTFRRIGPSPGGGFVDRWRIRQSRSHGKSQKTIMQWPCIHGPVRQLSQNDSLRSVPRYVCHGWAGKTAGISQFGGLTAPTSGCGRYFAGRWIAPSRCGSGRRSSWRLGSRAPSSSGGSSWSVRGGSTAPSTAICSRRRWSGRRRTPSSTATPSPILQKFEKRYSK